MISRETCLVSVTFCIVQFEVSVREHPKIVQELGVSLDDPFQQQMDTLETKFRDLYRAYDNYDKLLEQHPLVIIFGERQALNVYPASSPIFLTWCRIFTCRMVHSSWLGLWWRKKTIGFPFHGLCVVVGGDDGVSDILQGEGYSW